MTDTTPARGRSSPRGSGFEPPGRRHAGLSQSVPGQQGDHVMEQCQKVYDALDKFGIAFNLVEHPPALTTEDADRYIEGIEGVRTKTLFLSNRKKTSWYLVVMDDSKQLDMKRLGEILGESRMQFGSAEKLHEKMSLTPGIVSIFGLLNNSEKDIKVYFDKNILSESIMSFHANDNSKTVFISTDDMLKFVQSAGFGFDVIDL
ncbi:prolyl-tRNA synthetase associated domain-containing protein [Laribacter hongkongensis]|uniref:prolyl-tRNA synthetase associated domain-containing protein n=1 Tax=Laribacter hongkongensis TaxID=168471 RepID=UPI0027E51250|nr:prolyl-tRNA synthetase associated domain-containing protein [Laribacter hongkongensis]